MARWDKFKKLEKKVTLPVAQVEVILVEPDITSAFLSGEIALSDALFTSFAKATQEGDLSDAETMKLLNDDPETTSGLADFLDLLAIASFKAPKLVRDEADADFETTVPVANISMIDKMFVMQQFEGMFNQLSGLQTFRPQANGSIEPTSESE